MTYKSLLFALVASVLVMFGSVSQAQAQAYGAYNTYYVFAPGDDGTHNVFVGSASFYVYDQSHGTSSTLFMDDIDSAVAYLEYSSGTGGNVNYGAAAGNCTMGGMIVPCKMLF